MALVTFLSYGPYFMSAVVLLFTYLILKNRGLPPGPFSLPLIGNAGISDNKKLMILLKNLERKYGSIFRFRLGARHVTVVGGLENIKRVLEQDSLQPYRQWPNFITAVQPSPGQLCKTVCMVLVLVGIVKSILFAIVLYTLVTM